MELPNTWAVASVQEVFQINPKNNAADESNAGFVPMASISDGFSNCFTFEIKPWKTIKSGFTHFADNDVAVAKISPCLENRKSFVAKGLPNGIGAGTTELFVFRSYQIEPEYSLLFFKSAYFISSCVGTFNGVVGQQRASRNVIEELPFPIPPRSEQLKIIQKVKSLFDDIDIIEQGQYAVEDSVARCKDKILELAIHGRLVDQNPTDESALDLLKRINPSFKASDNLHYAGDLPKGWIRCRVSEAFDINPKVVGNDEDECAFVPMALVPDGYSNELRFEKRRWATIKKGFTRFTDGDIGVAKISPCLENRKSVIFRGLPSGIGAGTTELIIFRPIIVIAEYGLLFFKSEEYVSNCKGTYNGVVGQQRVDLSEIRRMYINIPPISEQHRIVETVKQLFNHLESIQRNNSL